MLVIGLAGKARTGKDTAAEHLRQKHGFVTYKMAGPLKAMLDVGLDLDEADYQTTEAKEAIIPWLGVSYRHAAQTLGTEWGRGCINPNIWILVADQFVRRQIALNMVESVPTVKGVVISDVRFDNEATWVRNIGGKVVHILRRDAPSVRAHSSEAGVKVWDEDRVVFNYGAVEGLYKTLDMLIGDMEAGK